MFNFCGWIGSCIVFEWNSLCNSLWPYKIPSNRDCFPANYSLVLKLWNFSTLNDLQYTVFLSCMAIYYINCCYHWMLNILVCVLLYVFIFMKILYKFCHMTVDNRGDMEGTFSTSNSRITAPNNCISHNYYVYFYNFYFVVVISWYV